MTRTTTGLSRSFVRGAEFDDATTIEFARLLAGEIGGFEPPPGYGA